MIHTDGKPTIANTRLLPPLKLRKYPERDLWETCPCAECSENDPDSMPGGYDNPQEPYDWSDDA